MRQGMPAQWRQLVRSVNRWETVVDYSNDGGREWTPCTFVDGSVTADATSQTRWSTNLTLSDTHVGRGGLNSFTTRLRVRHGIAGQKLLPMGVYRIGEPTQTWTEGRNRVQVNGESFESYFLSPDADFDSPRTIRATSAEGLVESLIHEVLPRATIVWRGDLNGSEFIPQVTSDGSPWSLIDGASDDPSAAKAVGGVVFCGPAGEWIVSPPGSLSDEPVWEFSESEANLVDSSISQSRDGFYNVVAVKGEPDDLPVVGPIFARDDDPTSITYWRRSPDDGGAGRRVFKYVAPTITRRGQALRLARSLLAQSLGLRQQVSFQGVHDPSLDPGDVVLVETPQGVLRMILDSITWDLTGASPMQAETRTTSTLLTGLTYQAPDLPA